MKKYLIIVMILLCSKAWAQQVENAHFDSLCVCAIDRVWDWVSSDTYYFDSDTAQAFAPDFLFSESNHDLHMAYNTVLLDYECVDTSGFVGAVALFSRNNLFYESGSNFKGFLFNGHHFYTNDLGEIDWPRCGTPFTYRPDSVSVVYKFEDSLSYSQEYGKMKVLLKKFNTNTNQTDTIGFAESTTELASTMQWKKVSFPIQYLSSLTPDSVLLVFYSSSNSGKPTTLYLDQVEFQYSSSDVSGLEKMEAIQAFPNPVKNIIYFKGIKGKAAYQVYNISGQLLESGTLHQQLSIACMPQGVYFLKIKAPDSIDTNIKILKY